MSDERMNDVLMRLRRKEVQVEFREYGDGFSGRIRRLGVSPRSWRPTYEVLINANHDTAARFAALAHELAHLHLGHLGSDRELGLRDRSRLSVAQAEIEAEAVAYIVCHRNGITIPSASYLSRFVGLTECCPDLYQIMRAAGQVEELLGLTASASFGTRQSTSSRRRASKSLRLHECEEALMASVTNANQFRGRLERLQA
jgi:hypothetical protein